MHDDLIPVGLCQCGCGTKTKIAIRTYSKIGEYKGQPRRFISGHNGRRPPLERFTEKYIVDSAGCWVWLACRTANGYGLFSSGGANSDTLAHRWAYEHFVGPIPAGLELDHLCCNRACCNPAHLEPVTRRENILRGIGPETTRQRHLAKRHCPAGHPYFGGEVANECSTYWPPPTACVRRLRPWKK